MQLKQTEPSVRIQVSLPNHAAQRLRQLAAEGSAALRALGILSVQAEGDSVISLKIAGQDINIRPTTTSGSNGLSIGSEAAGTSSIINNNNNLTNNAGDIGDLNQLMTAGSLTANNNNNISGFLTQQQRLAMVPNIDSTVLQQRQIQQQELIHQRRNIILGGPSTSSAAAQALIQKQVIQQQQQQNNINTNSAQAAVFKSPNTVCPMDSKVPMPPMPLNSTSGPSSREFPFESMRQARVLQGRDNALNNNAVTPGTPIPHAMGVTPSSSPAMLQHTPQSTSLMSTLGPPPNVALKVIKNPQSGEILTTTIAGPNKTQFIQPPPPPYPGLGNSNNGNTHNVGSPSSKQIVKPVQTYMQQNVISTSAPLPQTATSTSPASNNIAISSPLLVNLLQNDGNASNTSQLKSSLTSPSQQQMLQQQQSTMSPGGGAVQQQQHVMNSPMRSTPVSGNDYIVSQQMQVASDGSGVNTANAAIIGVPSSPTNSNIGMRSMPPQHQQQQVLLSPSSNNLYTQQQHQQRFQQQQISPQQAALLRQQQLQRQQQIQAAAAAAGIPPQRFVQQLQQQGVVNPILNIPQQIRQQVRPMIQQQQVQHQQQQQQPRCHNLQQPLTMQQQQSPFSATGGMSPAATAHSPASSHHSSSMHSPLMPASSHQSTLLSPSATPTQSPHALQQVQQQQSQQSVMLPPAASPAANNYQTVHMQSSSHMSSTSPHLPPPPDYNHAAAATRWPPLNKPMDSATKSSFQEFTRYQMQYNLQQQQINNNTNHPQQQQQIRQSLTDSNSASDSLTTGLIPNVSGNVAQELEASSTSATLNDPLITLSDLDALTPNDLDALLPTLSCDLDSTLSLEDKNELESLLQDAKDLDLDLIEENLSAVGMDVGEAAAAASSLLGAIDTQLPPNVTLNVNVTPTASNQVPQQQTTLQHQQQQQLLAQRQQQRQLLQQQQQIGVQQQTQLFVQQPGKDATTLPSYGQQHQQQHQLIVANTQRSGSARSTPTPTLSLTSHSKQGQFLINPLTGELEPIPSDDSETEAEQETKQMLTATSNASTPSSAVYNFSTSNEMPLPATIFSEEDSNSCSTGVSKISVNNGAMLGAGSDTDKSRDSLISNKSNRSRKSGKTQQQQQTCNKLGGSAAGANDMSLGSESPRSTNSSPLISAMPTQPVFVGTKKTKTNLLREKLQQGMRDRKKDSASANSVAKPKRERSKGGSKTKVGAMSAAFNATTTATVSETTASTEKIKLRLKIEKSEPVSPAYKVDVSFVQSPRVSDQSASNSSSGTAITNQQQQQQQQQQQYQYNAQTLAENVQQQQNAVQTPASLSSSVTQGTTMATIAAATTDEPRVPPLHISLRGGKNSIVIKNTRKDRKKSQMHSEEASGGISTVAGNGDESIVSMNKSKSLKRGYPATVSEQQKQSDGASDSKQQKLLNGTIGGGTPNYHSGDSKEIANTTSTTLATTTQCDTLKISATTTSLVAGKNGLTISAINTTTDKTNANTSQEQQLSKLTTSLPSSITLSTVPSNNPNLKNALKSTSTTTTITPIMGGGKPLTKNHKPPSYLAAVQQIQKQKQQQQQLAAALADKQTQQQVMAAAVTMLPSATTLKRVEIPTKVEKSELNTKIVSAVGTEKSKDVATELSETSGKASTKNVANIQTSVCALPPHSAANVVTTAAIVASLRNSPASNGSGTPGHGNSGGGEDSGIESMDALSEKSPHQQSSCSPAQQQTLITMPQQITTVSGTGSVATKADPAQHSPNLLGSTMDDEIEKELAKMQGDYNDLEMPAVGAEHFEAALLVGAVKHKPKVNGEHNFLEEMLSNDNDLIKNLQDIVEEHTFTSSDKLEDVVEAIKAELSTSHDELSEKGNKKEIKAESLVNAADDQKIKNTTNNNNNNNKHDVHLIKQDQLDVAITKPEIIKTEPPLAEENNEASQIVAREVTEAKCPSPCSTVTTKPTTVVDKSKCEVPIKQETVSIKTVSGKSDSNQASLAPISIEIPAQSESESTRIRTRASSRLESPMETVKSSPTLNSSSSTTPVTETTIAVTKTTHSIRTAERVSVSPKLAVVTTPTSTSVNHISGNNATKRKRIESESGNESDSKRSRTAGNATVSEVTEKSKSIANVPTAELVEAETSVATEKAEENWDSDEPLIEVAGKVRSAAAAANKPMLSESCTKNEDTTKTPAKPASESAAESTTISSASSGSTGSNEKQTRHARTHHQQSNNKGNTAQVDATHATTLTTATVTSTSTAISTPAATATNIKNDKSTPVTSTSGSVAATTSNNEPSQNVASTITTSSIATLSTCTERITSAGNSSVSSTVASAVTSTSRCSTPARSTTPTASHATRGISNSPANCITPTLSSSSSSTTTSTNNTSPTDEKIGTRRSVRASAAANKIIYSRSNAAAASNENKLVATKGGPGAASLETTGEPRRKTRSAVIGESMLTEGRRRRGSRDK